MTRGIKITLIAFAVMAVLPIVAGIALFIGTRSFKPPQILRREIHLPKGVNLIVAGQPRSRSEHGFSQRAGYREPGATEIEWFGDLSDGVEPQVYQSGPLLVVIDLPAAQLYVRTVNQSWKNLVLIFPNDLGPFPISFYAEKNGLTVEEVSRINELGGRRERNYPTTYIQSFDPKTLDLNCSYYVDNKSSWPLHLRLSGDGTRLVLVAIGGLSP